nr:hypothetical protein [Tanacetum cinerariifolium]
ARSSAIIRVADIVRRAFKRAFEQAASETGWELDYAPNMFSIRIDHGGKFKRYPGRMYVSGRVDIFDMVDIDLFTVVALNMIVLKLGYTGKSKPIFYNYLKPLTSLDEGLYALACEEDVRCMGTFVRSFKLIKQATASHVIDDVMRQLSFDETELDGEAGFADVAEGGCGQFREPGVGRTHEPILSEVSNQEPIMAEVSNEVPIEEEVGTQEFSVEDVVVEDYVSSGDDVKQGTDDDDDDDVDEIFLIDEENEIVEHEEKMWMSSMKMVSTVTLWKYSFYTGQKFTTPKEARDKVYLHSNESIMNLKLYKNDGVRIRARCDRKVPVFTMSQDAHDKGDLCPWVLYVRKDKFTKKWVVKTHNDTHTCLQSREIIHYTYKFLSKKIFEQVRISLDIPFKAVQDQLQRDLESTNHNTTVKIVVERNTVPSLPTRVFQRIYICLRVLKLGIRACRRDRLGLDGAFIKGLFPGQVLVAVRLDSNNRVYPLAYALAEAKSRAKSNLLLNNIYEVFNGKIVRGRDKPVITLLEYIREYCVMRIVNVQGGNNTKGSGSASGQAQQTEHAIGQDGSGGSGAGAVIGLSAAGEGGLGIASQGSSRSRWKKRRVQTKRISPQKRTPTQSISQPSSSSQVPMSKTKNAYGREIGDGVPTQSSVAGGASEWSFL